MAYQSAIALMTKGRANPSDYQVVLPERVVKEYSPNTEIVEYISYFTRALTLPSTTNSVVNLTGHENVGISRNVITGRQFGSPIVMTFTDRRDLLVYTTLKNWIDSTVQNSRQAETERNLRIEYYENIKHEIEIYKLEPKRNVRNPKNEPARGHLRTGKWTLINAFPLAIEQTTLGVESADALLDFTISIAFESFRYKALEEEDMTYAVNPYSPQEYEGSGNRYFPVIAQGAD